LAPAGWTWLKPSHEGLERELNWFNQLEGGMDTMSAREIKDIPPVSSGCSLN
jgi:hypothetical protein